MLISLSLQAEKYVSDEIYEITGHQLNKRQDILKKEIGKVLHLKREYSNVTYLLAMITNNYERRLHLNTQLVGLEIKKAKTRSNEKTVATVFITVLATIAAGMGLKYIVQ